MTAVIGVCGSDTAHILTDAAGTSPRDGTLMVIRRKQIAMPNGTVVAIGGLWPPAHRFVNLAKRYQTFDEVVEAAPSLWDEARENASSGDADVSSVLLLAGWSDRAARLELNVLRNADEHVFDVAAYAVGPSDESLEVARPFVDRFGHDPDAFDPRRHGLDLMETMRRNFPKAYALARLPAVGGYVQHTAIARSGITTQILRHWPDRIGRTIDFEDEGADMNWPGMSVTDLRELREILVHWSVLDCPGWA